MASSSARTVVIKASRDRVAEAQALADAECAKHKRSARLIKAPRPYDPDFIFDCID